MSGSDDVRRALARLTGEDDPIEHGVRAVHDLGAAAAFVEGGGLAELQEAVERAERRGDDERAARGRAARSAFERFRRAAAGDHFRPGHDTDIRHGVESPGE